MQSSCAMIMLCIFEQGAYMPITINLDEKTPEELKRLLDSVKISNLAYAEKEEWVQKIQLKLGIVMRDSKKEKELLAQIQEGQADIDDIL